MSRVVGVSSPIVETITVQGGAPMQQQPQAYVQSPTGLIPVFGQQQQQIRISQQSPTIQTITQAPGGQQQRYVIQQPQQPQVQERIVIQQPQAPAQQMQERIIIQPGQQQQQFSTGPIGQQQETIYLGTPTSQFITTPSLQTISLDGRSGDYWLLYEGARGQRSKMLHLGALNAAEVVAMAALAQNIQLRLNDLFRGMAEADAYINTTYTPIYNYLTGKVVLVNALTEMVADATYRWTRQQVERYFLAPFDASSNAPESLAYSRITLIPDILPYLYPDYYARG